MRKRLVFFLLVIGLSAFGWSWYHHQSKVVKIGFVANLGSDLGMQGRNGCLQAINEINRDGGLNGHPVQMVAVDNGNDARQAWSAVQSLAEQEIEVVIGHMTSEMSYTTHDLIEKSGIIMVSPTTATNLLSGKDDHFLSIYPSVKSVADKVASYAFRRDLKTFAILSDKSNDAFSRSWTIDFSDELAILGGRVEVAIPFDSTNMQASYYDLVRQINEACVDGVLIVADPMQTALIAQQFAKFDCKPALFATEWSYSPTLLSFGGEAIQELVVIQTFLPEAMDPRSLALNDRLEMNFGHKISFASAHAYDATRMVLAALSRNENPQKIKQSLMSLGTFDGVQSPIRLDQNGDSERIFYVRKISEGRVSLLAQL